MRKQEDSGELVKESEKVIRKVAGKSKQNSIKVDWNLYIKVTRGNSSEIRSTLMVFLLY